MPRDLLSELIGCQYRFKAANPELPDNYIVGLHGGGDSELLYIRPESFIKENNLYDWSVFNVVPAVSGGNGISFQSIVDSQRYFFESQNNLSLFRVPTGHLQPEVEQRQDATWLPRAPLYHLPDPKDAKNSFSFVFAYDQPNVILQSETRLSENSATLVAPQDCTWIAERISDRVSVAERWELVANPYNGGDTPLENHTITVETKKGISVASGTTTSESFSWSLGIEGGTDAVKASFKIGGEFSKVDTSQVTYSREETVTQTQQVTIPPKKRYPVYQKHLVLSTSSATLTAPIYSALVYGSQPTGTP